MRNETFITIISLLTLFFGRNCSTKINDEIPVFLWNLKGKSLMIKPISKFQQQVDVYKNMLKSAIQEGAHILMFLINELSLENFYLKSNQVNITFYNLQQYLDSQPHILMSSVKNPSSFVDEIHCIKQSIKIDKNFIEDILQHISFNLANSCVLMIHFDDVPWLEIEGMMQKVFLLSSEILNFPVIGAFTSTKSSWIPSRDNAASRKLLQTKNNEIPSKDIINYEDCILFYSKSINIIAKKFFKGTLNLQAPITSGSKCTNKSAVLLLTFKPTKYKINQIVIRFFFKNKGTKWDTYTSVNITTNETFAWYSLSSTNVTIGASSKKSYFCSNALMKPLKQRHRIALFFSNLKIQPFGVKDKSFSESYICIPSLNIITIEIVECIVICFLYIAILSWGFGYLLSIQNHDRLDDPKDNTVSTVVTIAN